MFTHNKPVYQDANPGTYPYAGNGGFGHTNLEKLLEKAQNKDNNLEISCLTVSYFKNSDFDSYILKLTNMENGLTRHLHKGCTFSNFNHQPIYNEYKVMDGRSCHFDVKGSRESLCQFMIETQDYTRNEFMREFPSKLERAKETSNRIITFRCHKNSINFFKEKLKEVKKLTTEAKISFEFVKGYHIGSFAVETLFFKNKFKLEISGNRCEVDLIIQQLSIERKNFLIDQKKPDVKLKEFV